MGFNVQPPSLDLSVHQAVKSGDTIKLKIQPGISHNHKSWNQGDTLTFSVIYIHPNDSKTSNNKTHRTGVVTTEEYKSPRNFLFPKLHKRGVK